MNKEGLLLVMLVGVICAVLIIFTFFVYTIDETMPTSMTSQSENFNVDNPEVNKVCTLTSTPSSITSVRYHNGTGWKTLGSGDYTLVGNVLTVKASAMN